MLPAFPTIFGRVTTLTFDLSSQNLTSLSFDSKCIKVVNLVKLPKVVYKILHSQTDGCTRVQPENIIPPT